MQLVNNIENDAICPKGTDMWIEPHFSKDVVDNWEFISCWYSLVKTTVSQNPLHEYATMMEQPWFAPPSLEFG